MSLRSAGAQAVTGVAAGARAGVAIGGIVIGGGLGGFLAILGIVLLILLLLQALITAIDTFYPPTTERVRHYTRAFDKFRRNPDGSAKDPDTDPPRDIIQIERFLIGGIFKASPEGTLDPESTSVTAPTACLPSGRRSCSRVRPRSLKLRALLPATAPLASPPGKQSPSESPPGSTSPSLARTGRPGTGGQTPITSRKSSSGCRTSSTFATAAISA